jgi:chromosome segregation ATPase
MQEATRRREELVAELADLNQRLGDLATIDDPSTQLSREEQALKRYVWAHYKDRKHRDHLMATLLAQHRQRRLQRFQAASAALALAADFLQPDEALLRDLQQANEEALARQKGEIFAPQELPTERKEGRQSITLRRASGSDEAQTIRERLASFDALVKQMRSTISQAAGWVEMFMVRHVRLDMKAVMEYRKKHGRLPDEPILKETIHGPYGKYRWREGRHQYTISLGPVRLGKPSEEMPEEWERL